MQKCGHDVCVRILARTGEVVINDAIVAYVPLFGKEFPRQYKQFVEFFRDAVRKFNAHDRSGWFTDSMSEAIANNLFATGIKYELVIDGEVEEDG